jgi:outer membrane biosynthesis protein TonB
MKQCPNPNCILYTRLEELPDAYTRCPGCGGQLVDANMLSGHLRSGHLMQRPNGGLGQRDIDQEFQEAFPEQSFAQPTADAILPQPPDDEYYPYEDTEQDESVEVQPLGISRGARIAYLLALLLLLFACVLFTFVVTSRFLNSASVTNADATETAIVALRPAVNTPILVMPTVQQSELPPETVEPPTQPPTSPPQPPTATAEQPQLLPPTQAPIIPPTPTNLPLPPQPSTPQTQPVAPTAPPAQPQPTGGVTNARMVIGLDAGQPAGNVSAYHANDAFVLAVQAQFGPGGVTSMKTRWYGPDGLLLYEIPRDFPQQGTYFTGFTLKKSSPWATGDYRVDIYTNNSPSPAYSISFSVVP